MIGTFQFIKAICNLDVGMKPMIYHRVYIINISKKTIFHIYDDRGCDVISASREELMDIYKEFNDWILDYDQERMNNVFRGSPPQRSINESELRIDDVIIYTGF